MTVSQKFGNQINSITYKSLNTCTSDGNSYNKADCNKCSCWEGDDGGWNGGCPILGAHNEEIAVEEDNKGWRARHPFLEIRDRDVTERLLDIEGLKTLNILKTILECQMPEDGGTFVERLSIV